MGHLLVLDLPAQTYKKNRDQPILGDLGHLNFSKCLGFQGPLIPKKNVPEIFAQIRPETCAPECQVCQLCQPNKIEMIHDES